MATKNEEEPRIPVFTVLKNGAILKNIFIVNSHNNTLASDQTSEQVLIIGRHPDCNVALTHPSISRYHLKIISVPSSRKLSVIDLSSVHGTWVSEKKIEPWDRVELHEGDSLRIGGSSRVYRLHWIPLSQAYDVEPSYDSKCDEPIEDEENDHMAVEALQVEISLPIKNEIVEEEDRSMAVEMEMTIEKKECDGGNNSLLLESREVQPWGVYEEDLSSLFSESLEITVKEIPTAPPLPDYSIYSILDENEEGVESPLKAVSVEKEFLSRCENELFWSTTEKLTSEDVSLDYEFLANDIDAQSTEPSFATEVCERESTEVYSRELENQSLESHPVILEGESPNIGYRELENPSPVKDGVGAREEVTLLVGEVSAESSSQHAGTNSRSVEAFYDVEFPYHSPKQEYSPSEPKPYMFSDFDYPASETVMGIRDMRFSEGEEEPRGVSIMESANSSLLAAKGENRIPESRSGMLKNRSTLRPDDKPTFESIWLRRGNSDNAIQLQPGKSTIDTMLSGVDSEDGNHNQEDMDDKSALKEVYASLNEEKEDDFTPDKENFTPNTYLVKSLRSKGSVVKPDLKSRLETMLDGVDSDDGYHNLEEMEDKSALKEVYASLIEGKDEAFTPDKENSMPNTYLVESLRRNGSLVKLAYPSLDGESVLDTVDSEDGNHKLVDMEDKSALMEVYASLSEWKDEAFTPDKENFTPNTYLVKSLRRQGSVVKSNLMAYRSSLEGEDENLTPNKENFTPNTYLEKFLKRKGKLVDCDDVKRSQDCAEDASNLKASHSLFDGEEDENFTPDKENYTPNSYLSKSLKWKDKLVNSGDMKHYQDYAENTSTLKENRSSLDGEEDEIFTPNKENITPKPHQPKSLRKKAVLEEIKIAKPSRLSPLKITCTRLQQNFDISFENENKVSGVLQELKPRTSGSKVRLGRELMAKKKGPERVPFQSLVEKSDNSIESSARGTSLSVNNTRTLEQRKKITNAISNNSVRQSQKAWTMVADIGTLLNKQSRKYLQLLQGVKHTCLVIPRMVLRELATLKQHGSLFSRKNEACVVLEWIEQCMVEFGLWIHIQTSAEDLRLTAPTPPASPQTHFNNGSGWSSCDETMTSLPFPRCMSLAELVSPTTEDHILECALMCRRANSDRRVVLLSDDVTLKIKAMAEGLICEPAREFRGSLMNPFSERYLWADSSPRGQTWSIEDDVVLREKYDHWGLKRQLNGESAKGLKLILLHNSQYGHKKSLVS